MIPTWHPVIVIIEPLPHNHNLQILLPMIVICDCMCYDVPDVFIDKFCHVSQGVNLFDGLIARYYWDPVPRLMIHLANKHHHI